MADTNGKAVVNEEQKMDRLERLIGNVMSTRSDLFRKLFDPRRDINDECGYPSGWIESQFYQDLYEQVLPKECWQVQPEVYEDKDSENITEFEEAWDTLGQNVMGEDSYYQDEEGSPIWEYLRRLDILSGIGQYGVMLVGTDDGKELREPASQKQGTKLLYLRCFPEYLAQVTQYESDPKNPRFGRPNMYLITFHDPRDVTTGVGLSMSTTNVHWTRVVHVADNLASNEVFGVPRMRPVLNRLLDLRKLYGGSAEMYWRGAFPGWSLETHPQLGGDVDINVQATRDMMENYMNGLQRYLSLTGMSAKSLAPQVVDPTPQINTQLEAICIQLGIPVRVFKGSERGELASSQDDGAWNDRLKERQRSHITPRIIAPFIDRLISLGILPVPSEPRTKRERPTVDLPEATPAAGGKGAPPPNGKPKGPPAFSKNRLSVTYNADGSMDIKNEKGGYSIHWPDVTSQTAQERATVMLTRTQAYGAYIQGGVEAIIPPLEYVTEFDGMDPEEAAEMLENAAKQAEEKEAEDMLKQQEMIDKGLAPDPTQPPPQAPGAPIKMGLGETLVGQDGKKIHQTKPAPAKK